MDRSESEVPIMGQRDKKKSGYRETWRLNGQFVLFLFFLIGLIKEEIGLIVLLFLLDLFFSDLILITSLFISHTKILMPNLSQISHVHVAC